MENTGDFVGSNRAAESQREHISLEEEVNNEAIESCQQNDYKDAEIATAVEVYKKRYVSKKYSGRELSGIMENLREGKPPFDADNFQEDHSTNLDQSELRVDDQSGDENGKQFRDENDHDDQSKDIQENQTTGNAGPNECSFYLGDQSISGDQLVNMTGDHSITVITGSSSSVTTTQSISTTDVHFHLSDKGPLLTKKDENQSRGFREDLPIRNHTHDITKDDWNDSSIPICGCYDSEEILTKSWEHLVTCQVCATQAAAMPAFCFNFVHAARKLAWLYNLRSNE